METEKYYLFMFQDPAGQAAPSYALIYEKNAQIRLQFSTKAWLLEQIPLEGISPISISPTPADQTFTKKVHEHWYGFEEYISPVGRSELAQLESLVLSKE